MQRAFRAILQGAPTVTAFCGGRIDWGARLPDDPYPAILMHLIGDVAGHTLTGSDGLSRGRVQVDCYAEDYADAADLAKAVGLVLDGYRQDGFRGIFLDARRDNTERGANEADRPFRVTMDFLTNWRSSNV
ncbi:tail completion protein gp17 [Parasedimentitalea psychrophila]|uniref:DUF3168 domain-containing protein n=1 Tax=Parasedimentitalea psychrophila TaxID=2997337 RepID=A0A9Y2KZD9_9RHOB|nr:DUF3168 domain-containing protein [Parasedimentitalea psychrophila]WIY25120.1 DUF3168 domain-containing protein [Parasedimentitalea psychrophila]